MASGGGSHRHPSIAAEDTAGTYQFTREAQDAYAVERLTRATAAIASGAFKAEITPVEVAGRKGTVPPPRTTALGHPIGASGARVLTTLLAARQARGGTKGVASLCIGGGETVAMAVERA